MSQKECRVLDAELMDIRVHDEEGETPRVVGRIPYNQWSKVLHSGGIRFREIVRPGAFRSSLDAGDDVKARIEHEGGLSLIGRTKNDTLKLRDTPNALEWEVEPPNTSAGRDILELARRGDIDTSSFAFITRPNGDKRYIGEDGIGRRELLDVALRDVAPVSSPAYEDTTVAVRSMEELEPEPEPETDEDEGEGRSIEMMRREMEVAEQAP